MNGTVLSKRAAVAQAQMETGDGVSLSKFKARLIGTREGWVKGSRNNRDQDYCLSWGPHLNTCHCHCDEGHDHKGGCKVVDTETSWIIFGRDYNRGNWKY